MEFQKLIKQRRSVYALDNKSPVSDEKIVEAVKNVILNAPTAFDTQATHVVIALGDKHRLVWDITKNTLKKILPEERYVKTEKKLDVFQAGYGTVLVYKDLNKIEELKKGFPAFANRQDDWGEQNIGILVYGLWLALTELGLGVNIQHYDPLIDEEIKKNFPVKEGWKLETEVVFGAIKANPGEKKQTNIDERVAVSL
ncbi:MAG: nitroreductase family protein [Bacilli bacterium]